MVGLPGIFIIILFSMFVQSTAQNRSNVFQKLFGVLFVAIAALALGGCSLFDGQRAIDYNDQIVALHEEVINQFDAIGPMLNQQDIDVDALEKERQALSDLIKTNTEKLESIQKMSDDQGFYDATLAMFKAYQSFVDTEMADYFAVVGEIVNMDANASDEEMTALEDKEAKSNTNFEDALKKIGTLEDAAVEAQKSFAEKYDITLI